MKKILVFFALFVLSACVYAGEVSVWDARKGWLERIHSYPIEYFDQGSTLVKTEYITEKNFPTNEILTAYVGYTVVDAKTYQKDLYATDLLRANGRGVLNSASVPVVFAKNEEKKVIGQVIIDDVNYLLATSDKYSDNYVVLVDKEGRVFHKMGQIRYKRLVLMNPEYVVFPESFRLEPVTTSKSEQTEPVKGFDIKYEGLKLDRMVFTYLDYADSQGDSGRFENLSYPKNAKNIDIKGVGIKVLHASNKKLDYIILKDK